MSMTMQRGRAALVGLLAIVTLAAGLLLATGRDAGAVETEGTVQACVSRYTGVIVLRDQCSQYEDWLLIEGGFNNPEPPPRERPTVEPTAEPEPTPVRRR